MSLRMWIRRNQTPVVVGGSAGFTLIELMIAVAVVAILAAVAYPSYVDQVRKGRRAEAQAVLLEASQFMERFATENQRYDQNLAGTAVALPTGLATAPKASTTVHYNVSLQSKTQTTYVLQAVPTGSQASDTCGTMTLSQTGVTTPSTSSCWRR